MFTSLAIIIFGLIALFIFKRTIGVAASVLPDATSDVLKAAAVAAKQLNNEVSTLASEARVSQRERLTVAAAQYKALLAEDSRSDAEILREMGF